MRIGKFNIGKNRPVPIDEIEQKKQDEIKQKKSQKAMKQDFRKMRQLKDEVQGLIEGLWEKKYKYLQTAKEYRLYQNVFCEEGGILNYTQLLDGLCHYDLKIYDNIGKLKLKIVDQLISGLNSTISAKMKRSGKSFIIPEAFEIAMTKEAFINNENLDMENCNDEEKLLAMKKRMEDKNRQLENDLCVLDTDYNNVFYKKLWNNSHMEIEDLLDYYLSTNLEEYADIENLRADVCRRVSQLKNALGDRIKFKYYEAENTTAKEKRDLFELVEKGDNCPAILKDENILINKGKITRVKAAQL